MEKTIRLTYYGVSCWLFETEYFRLLIDPGSFYIDGLPKKEASLLNNIDTICFTHADFDHCNRLRYIRDYKKIKIIGPSTIKKKFPELENFENITPEKNIQLEKNIKIQHLDIKHGLRFWVKHNGYLIHINDLKILHTGDGNDSMAIVNSRIDVLMVTIGGFQTNEKKACELGLKLKPGLLLPMHWNGNFGRGKVERLKRLLDWNGEIVVQDLGIGESITI